MPKQDLIRRALGRTAISEQREDMIPDQVMDAIHFAEFVMAKEKHDCIGSSAATVYPMKFFLFHGQKEIMGLLGSSSV